jgi:hypothetical protein
MTTDLWKYFGESSKESTITVKDLIAEKPLLK